MAHIELDVPDLRVLLKQPNTIVNQSNVSMLEVAESAVYAASASYAQYAEFSATSSFALNASAGPLENVFYVTQEGNDEQDGSTLELAFRSIKRATEAAAEYISSGSFGQPTRRVSIHVKSGYYTEQAPITVPNNTSILGDDLRTVVIRPTAETKTQNLFLMNNASYVWGLRLEGCEVDDLEDPRSGFFFAFAPGAFIATSPYVQNCTAVHTPPHAFYAPLDPDNANPFVGKGPGGMLVDDSVLDGYSPLKSMIVDAYTQVAFNGIGICIRGRGYAQLVSFFTNFSRIGVYTIDGGHASLLNSNTSFGDYGLRAKGSRILVIPDRSNVSTHLDNNDATIIQNSKNLILNYMISELQLSGSYSSSYDVGSSYYESTLRDAGLLIDSVITDLRSPKPARTVQFTQGLFKAQDTTPSKIFTTPLGAVAVFPVNDGGLLTQDFILSYEKMRDYIIEDPFSQFSGLSEDGRIKIQQLFDMPINTLTSVILNNSDELLQVFGSLITSTSHDFSYAGAGVNFLALPANQGGIGETDLELRIVEEDGGRVYHTSGDETGDFYAGSDFVIRQSTGTIDGRTFTKALAGRFVPINLALEG
jgi:hypothetical protein